MMSCKSGKSRARSQCPQQAKKIFSSSKLIIFTNFQNKSKLVSENILVPEINAIWWIQVVPGDSNSIFDMSQSPPDIKLIIRVDDQEIAKSKAFVARLNMTESAAYSHHPISNMFFSKYTKKIDKMQVEFNTKSHEYQDSPSVRKPLNVYCQWLSDAKKYSSISWESKRLFQFNCSIDVGLLCIDDAAKYDMTMQASKKVLSSEVIASLLDDDTFSDFTFVIRGREFKVHKCLLSAASEVFKTMFTCGLDETKTNTAIVDCDPDVFSHFIQFIYKGLWSVKKLTEICMELYELSHRYGVEPLSKICLAFLTGKTISYNNALELFEFALTYDVENMREDVWDFIKTEMLDIQCPCEPKSMDQIKTLLESKRKYEEMKQAFMGEELFSAEPSKKKPRTSKN